MKKLVILLAVAFLAACQTDSQGNVEPTAETREAGQDVKDGAQAVGAQAATAAEQVRDSEAGQRVAEGAQAIGQGVKQGAGEAAEAAGDALKREGQEAQAEVKKSDPPTTTTR